VAGLIPWSLVLSPGPPAGGDTPSHYAAFVYFAEQVLPHGRLWGWQPGNLAGFPLFQFYFPLPFLIMAGLKPLLQAAPAFKLVALLPALLLPLSAYLCLRQLGLTFPGPALGAVLSLGFILDETNQVWGGNLASILAGEFAYAWGLNLCLIYLGRLRLWLKGDKGPLLAGLLLGLIGLAHAYALLFSLLAGLYFLLAAPRPRAAALRLLAVYGLGFLLLAHWLVPMLVYSPDTEMFNVIWTVSDWRSFLPPTLWPALVLAAAWPLLIRRWGRPGEAEAGGYLLFWILASAGLFLLAPLMNSVDIRFAPFGHLAAVLLAAQSLSLLTRRLAGQGLLALLVLVLGAAWAGGRVSYLPHWLDWNNAGIEVQPLWPAAARLSRSLRGGPAEPRVAYEHSSICDRAGSVRLFESLPRLAGRSTLEGLYLQAGPSSPFVFYLQSELSRAGSSPLPGYVYSRRNLPRALEHLKLFNVSHYVAVEESTKALAEVQPGLIPAGDFPPFRLYRVAANPGRYAVTPAHRPVLVITGRPQAAAFQWFRFSDLTTPLVFGPRPPPDGDGRFARVFLDSGRADEPLLKLLRADGLPREKLEDCPIRERVSAERIELAGLCPGRPVLIKISYHPAWRSLSGEEVLRASPAFMLVFPRGERLTLVFGPAWPHWLGLGLTGLGLALLVLLRLRPGLLERAWLEQGSGRTDWPLRAVVLGLALALLAGLWSARDDASTLRQRAQGLTDRGRPAEARRLLERALERFPMSLVSDYTWYDLAMTHLAGGDFVRAEETLRRLLEDFPDSVVRPEGLYHLGLSLREQGRVEEAARTWRELIRDFPDNPWAARAGERL